MKLLFTALACFLSLNIFSQNDYSMSFDGQDDYVLGMPIGLPTGNVSATMSAWIKMNSTQSNSAPSIFCYGEEENYKMWGMGINENGFYFLGYSNDITQNWNYTTDVWYYVSLVTSGTTVKWYVNGTQLGADGILPQTPNIGSEFYILSKQRPNNPDAYFNGLIDDISIWSHALSQEDIQMYMECPPVGDEEGLAGYWNFEAGPFAPVLDLSDNGNNGVAHGASWINETNNTQCLASLCEQIDITFLSLNTDVSPNTIEFEIDVQYDDEYGFGYGGFVLANDEGDIVAQETLETAGNVYWIGQGINETRLLIANEELSFPFSGNLYLVEGFFSGNSNAECVYYFNPGCINETACNYNPDANQDDMSCYFIGDLCDDNDDTTGNDAYNYECECAGTTNSTIDELEALSVLIYPNPASNNLTVDLGDLNGVNTTIKLYDSSSKLVFEKQASSTLTIDISGFTNSMYSLELATDEQVLRSQVIIE